MKTYKRTIILVGLLFLTIALPAADLENAMSLHRDNFFIIGTEDFKFQISAKYNMLSPTDIGLYFAYTGLALWDIYGESSPLSEYNHKPEIFFLLQENKNIFWDSSLGIVDFIRIAPYDHNSNGRDGPLSRGLDRYYGEIQFSIGEAYTLGIRLKGWNYYRISKENRDITDYMGYGEGEIFFLHRYSDTKIYIRGGPGTDLDKGWFEAGFMIRPFNTYIKPYMLFQVYHGYGESLVGYNKKETMYRVGFVFH